MISIVRAGGYVSSSVRLVKSVQSGTSQINVDQTTATIAVNPVPWDNSILILNGYIFSSNGNANAKPAIYLEIDGSGFTSNILAICNTPISHPRIFNWVLVEFYHGIITSKSQLTSVTSSNDQVFTVGSVDLDNSIIIPTGGTHNTTSMRDTSGMHVVDFASPTSIRIAGNPSVKTLYYQIVTFNPGVIEKITHLGYTILTGVFGSSSSADVTLSAGVANLSDTLSLWNGSRYNTTGDDWINFALTGNTTLTGYRTGTSAQGSTGPAISLLRFKGGLVKSVQYLSISQSGSVTGTNVTISPVDLERSFILLNGWTGTINSGTNARDVLQRVFLLSSTQARAVRIGSSTNTPVVRFIVVEFS